MKLSDFKNEEALDVLAEILEPAAIVMADKELVSLARNAGTRIKAVSYALRNHKKEVIAIIAALHRQEPDKVEFNIASLGIDLLELFNDKALQEVFSLQSQTTSSEFSGSATESTEEGG